jgi:hypothetical protein
MKIIDDRNHQKQYEKYKQSSFGHVDQYLLPEIIKEKVKNSIRENTRMNCPSKNQVQVSSQQPSFIFPSQ